MSRKKSCGFTLVEMILVVIITGLLASIAGVQYFKVIERSRGAEAKQVLLTAYAGYQRRVANEESVAWGQICQGGIGRWDRLGMSTPSATRFIYSCSNAGGNPDFIAVRVGDANKNLTINLATGNLVMTAPY